MTYFVVTLLSKGIKNKKGFYAKDMESANAYAKANFFGMIIKLQESEEPLEIKLKKIKNKIINILQKKKIDPDILIASIRQLAVMTNASISIYESIIEIGDATHDKTLKHVFNKIAEDINAGYSLSKALGKFRFEVGSLTIAMVQLGEKTGRFFLSEV